MVDKISNESVNMLDQNLEKLKQIFPSCFTEDKLNFKKLEELLKPITNTKEESYSFSWAGRANSIKNIQIPAKTTLVPQKDESIDFDNTENIFIEGENLEVLKLLQKSYSGKIKMIYIDPPYNTGNDFVYNDDFTNDIPSYLEQTGQSKDGVKLTSNLETSGRFHSDWISFMYPRLFLARDLLRDDGVIFVSIDDNEIHNLRYILNDVFGEENFVTTIVWQKKFSRQNDAKYFSDTHEYLLCFAKSKPNLKLNLLPRTEKQNERYDNPDNDPRGVWMSGGLDVKTYSAQYDYPIKTPSGRVVNPPKGTCWRVPKDGFEKLVKDNRIWFGKDGTSVPRIKRFLSEVKQGLVPVTLWLRDDAGDTQEAVREFNALLPGAKFDNPKPTKLLRIIQLLATTKEQNDVILDFFVGSGTTAHSILQQNQLDGGNRKFLLIQLPQVIFKDDNNFNKEFNTISDICKERIRRAIKQIKEESKQQKLTTTNQDLGFKIFD